MANRWRNNGNSDRLSFLGLQKSLWMVTAATKIKRSLLLERKVMTNLDSILKSRDITLPTKVHLVKGMVFPVVMFGCESWTMKKAEHQRIDAFELWCWESFESPLNCNIKLVNPKGKQSWIFIGRTDTEPVVLILWLPDGRADSFEKTLMLGKIEDRRRGWQDEMVGWLHWLSGHEFDRALGIDDGQGSLVCCSLWGHKEVDMTERLNWIDAYFVLFDSVVKQTWLSWVIINLQGSPIHFPSLMILYRD